MTTLIGKKEQVHYATNWHLVGGNKIGGKAQALYDRSLLMEEAGFIPNPRAVLSMHWTEILKSKDRKLSEKQIDDLKLILQIFKDNPFLVVRSSANGDSRGTGAYKSVYCKNNLNDLIKAINDVLDSENNPSAILFRRDAGFESGMAIIIEPIVGRHYDCIVSERLMDELREIGRTIDERKIKNGELIEVFAPAISGFGYTSTAYGEGYIKLVFGLASLAAKGYGELFTLSRMYGNLGEFYYSRDKRHKELSGRAHIINENGEFDDGRYIFYKDNDRPILMYKQDTTVDAFKLPNLKEPTSKLEKLIGRKQYFEFASVMDLVAEALIERTSITQISDINETMDNIEFPENPKNVLLLCGDEIFGSGNVKCNGAYWASSVESLNGLKEYNKEHKNYALVLSAHNISSAFSFSDLEYSAFNNMGAMIILGHIPYGGTVEGHMGGFLREVKKIAIHDNKLEAQFFIKNLMEKMGLPIPDDERDYPTILNCSLEVIASESRGKGLVIYLDQ